MKASNDEVLKYKNAAYKVVYVPANKYFVAGKDDPIVKDDPIAFDKYFVLPVDQTLNFENIIAVRITLDAAIKEADFLQNIRQLIIREKKNEERKNTHE